MRTAIEMISDCHEITENGQFRLKFHAGHRRQDFSAVWDESNTAAPAGTLVLSYQGNLGTAAGVLNLATSDNVRHANARLPFIDVDVTGLPEGGRIFFHVA